MHFQIVSRSERHLGSFSEGVFEEELIPLIAGALITSVELFADGEFKVAC